MTDMMFEGKWREMKGAVKEKWGKLTDDDISAWQGKLDQLVGAIQERYGYTKEQAQQQVAEFVDSFKSEAA